MKTRWSVGSYAPNCSVSKVSKANKKKSPDLFVVESNWQVVSTKNLLVEIKQVWQEELPLVADDHNIVKQEENKDSPEGKNEHKSVIISSNLQLRKNLV